MPYRFPLALAVAVLLAVPCSAQWEFIGPAQTQITGYASDATTRYLATTEGIFERALTDERWAEITDNLPDRRIESLVQSANGLFVNLGSDGFWHRTGGAWVKRVANGAVAAQGTVLYGFLNGDVWTSTDDGASWQKTATQPTESNSDPKAIAVLGDDVFVVDGAATFRTSDGGATWTQTPLTLGAVSLLADPAKDAVYAVTVVGGGKGLFRSTDRGGSWTRIYDPGLFANVGAVAVSGDVILLTVGAAFVRSDDSGATFDAPVDNLPVPSTFSRAPVSLYGDPNGFYLTLALGTYTSADGQSWDGFSDGLTATNDVEQAVNHRGTLFAVTGDAIAHTAPADLEWEPYCMVIPDVDACYNGALLSGVAQTDEFLYVFFGNANLRSRDGGATFERTSGLLPGSSVPNPGPRFAGSGDRVYAMSRSGLYAMTDADGAEWTQVLDVDYSNTDVGLGVVTVSGSTILVNSASNTYVTTDGGTTWVMSPIRNANGTIQGDRVWLSPEAYTDDGGATVVELTEGAVPATTDIHAVRDALVVGGRTGIHLSLDDGATWEDITGNFPSGDKPQFEASYLFHDADYLYASLKYNVGSNVDQGGGLWRRTLGGLGLGSTADEPAGTAAGLRLDAPRPNPTGGVASVSFTLATPTRLTLGVYDLLGRRVAEVADGAFPAGPHALDVDARGLAPGLYLVRLQTPTEAATQRLVVVR